MILSGTHGGSTLRRGGMADVRRTISELADAGFTIGEITARFRGELTELEHELIWRIACAETRRARGERLAPGRL